MITLQDEALTEQLPRVPVALDDDHPDLAEEFLSAWASKCKPYCARANHVLGGPGKHRGTKR